METAVDDFPGGTVLVVDGGDANLSEAPSPENQTSPPTPIAARTRTPATSRGTLLGPQPSARADLYVAE